jgi:2-C-methyl-D-erythritol 4-phosphate cytidylyltransferase
MINNQKVGAVIVAAGSGERMGGVDKMLAPLGGRTVLVRVVGVFQECPAIDEIVVVLGEHNIEAGQRLLEGFSRVVAVCRGGERRQDSVLAGINQLGGCQWLVIHDGARPLLTVDLITDGLAAASESGAAACAVPVTDTIKLAGDDDYVRETLSRKRLWAVQTPQVFRSDIITEAYRQAQAEFTDDAALVEKAGYRVKLYKGSYGNIKITTPAHLALAGVLLGERGG